MPQASIPSVSRQASMSQAPTQAVVNSPAALLATASPVPVRSPVAPIAQHSPVPVPPVPYHQPQVAPSQVYQPALQQRRSSGFVAQSPMPGAYPGAATPHSYAVPQAPQYAPYQVGRAQGPPAMYNSNAPRPIEVFHLSDTANAAIPEDVRQQFHCDDQGRVLFFSCPPVDISSTVYQKLGHSLKYLAAKEERQRLVEAKKRKESSEQQERDHAIKRQRADEETAVAVKTEAAAEKAVKSMAKEIMNGTDQIYKALYWDQAEAAREADTKAREQQVQADRVTRAKTARIQGNSTKATFVNLKGSGMYMDEIDPAT